MRSAGYTRERVGFTAHHFFDDVRYRIYTQVSVYRVLEFGGVLTNILLLELSRQVTLHERGFAHTAITDQNQFELGNLLGHPVPRKNTREEG